MYEKMYANLHFHSTHSDGVDTPEDLVKIAKEEGYGALALADHDTATGTDIIIEACKEAGLEYIAATEFSTNEEIFGEGFHIVGFDFDKNEPKMCEYLQYLSEKTCHRTRTMLENGLKRGTLHDITWNEVVDENPGITYLCVDHVYAVMKKKGVITDSEYPAFHKNNFSYTIPYESPYDFRNPEDTIKVIKNAGGVAVLAHPCYKQMKFVPELVKMGLGGIESWHPDHSDEEAVAAEELAKKYNIYISGGTDHSGLMGGQYAFYADKPENPYYVPSLKYGVTEENFKKLKERVLG